MQLKYDSLLFGIIIGSITIIIGYGVISYIFDLLTMAGIMEESSTSMSSSRQKTLWLLAICCNLIPFNVFKNKKMDNALRGVVFPTILAVGYWVYTYFDVLFGSF